MKNIILIDDEPDVLEILKEFLEYLDHNVDPFENPKLALEKFSQKNYDILITDINLPEIDGYELISKIRKIDSDIPIVIISGYIDDFQKENILKKGANAYIEKPFTLSKLQETIDNVSQGDKCCQTQIA